MTNKLDFDKPDQLQTRDGKQVRIYATDGMGLYCIHGAILDVNEWIIAKWTLNGSSCIGDHESRNDLVRKPARVTGWVNIYEKSGCLAPSFGDVTYITQQLAKENVLGRGECFGQIFIDEDVQT